MEITSGVTSIGRMHGRDAIRKLTLEKPGMLAVKCTGHVSRLHALSGAV